MMLRVIKGASLKGASVRNFVWVFFAFIWIHSTYADTALTSKVDPHVEQIVVQAFSDAAIIDAADLTKAGSEQSLLNHGFAAQANAPGYYTLGHPNLYQTGERVVFHPDHSVTLLVFASGTNAAVMETIELDPSGAVTKNVVNPLP
jgi:hypothetical protein